MPIQFDPFVASQGLAAGLAGKLPEFQQTQNQKAQLDLEKKKQDDEMQIKIQESQFKDAYAAQQLLSGEDYDGIVKLGITRLTMLQGLNANPAETQRVLKLAIAARNGDPDARRLLKGELDSAVKVGQATGVLKAPEKEDPMILSEGQVAIDSAGKIIARGDKKTEAAPTQSEFEKTRQTALGLERYLLTNPNDAGAKKQLDLVNARLETFKSTGSDAAINAQADTTSFLDGSIRIIPTSGPTRLYNPDGSLVEGAEETEEWNKRTQLLEETRLATEKSNAAKATDAIKFSNAAFEQSDLLRNNIYLLNQALEAVNEGANTGPIDSLWPSLSDAGVKLDDAQRKLGLNIIQETTFGALSRAELLLALETALPAKLSEGGLAPYLQDKMIVTAKLAAYLEETGDYLAQPGNNLAGWRKLKREELNETKDAIKFALDNPKDERSPGILADPRSITVLKDNPDLRMR